MFEADKTCGVVESAFFLVAPPRGGLSVAPRDSDRCWKQFMMFLEGIRFVAMIHLRSFNLIPVHVPELGEFERPA